MEAPELSRWEFKLSKAAITARLGLAKAAVKPEKAAVTPENPVGEETKTDTAEAPAASGATVGEDNKNDTAEAAAATEADRRQGARPASWPPSWQAWHKKLLQVRSR